MSGTETLIAAVLVAAVGLLAAYLTAFVGRLLNVLLLTWRVWRLAARHPRTPNKRFPWGTLLTVALGGAFFWTSMAVATVLLAEWGLGTARQFSVRTAIPTLNPLGDRWLLLYALLFAAIVVTFTILSPIAWRKELRERDWKRTLRGGLKRLIAETTVPPEREHEWKRAQRDALESMTELPLQKFVSRDLLKEFAVTMTAKGYFCFSATLLDDPERKLGLWQRCARLFGKRRAAGRLVARQRTPGRR